MNLMLENLNPEQKIAVETTEGPVLVLSGAGTGKTRVLTTRIAYLLAKGLAVPWQIMALTFTNKAANEMKNRIASMADTGLAVGDLWCGTFHSICLRILRANADRIGIRRDFLVFGEDDQKSVLKTVILAMGWDIKEYNPSDWVEKNSSIKDKGLGYQCTGKAAKIFDAYNAEMTRMNAIDFGDIILKVLELFANAPDVLAKYQRQFKYVLVDEFQDTNNAQHQFLKAISDGYGNICCVGDDDQSIYSWRGAEIAHILNFDKTYPTAKIIRLETNYRSTENILGAANSLIRHNTGRLGKDLRVADGCAVGEKAYVMTLPTEWDEGRMIAEAISRQAGGDGYSDFAVLIRAGSLSRILEEEFTERGIPYRLVGATKFYDRMEIRDAIAYVRLLVHSFDDLSFLRVIAKPRRGFGPGAIEKMRGFGDNLMEGLRICPLSGRQRESADEFLKAFDFNWDAMKPSTAVEHLLSGSGYLKMWEESKEPDAADRLTNVRELISNVIAKYDSLADFLEHAALMMTDDNDTQDRIENNAVSIMTIHAAKGLEFKVVFLPAWEDGIFPNEKAINDAGVEEERRLAYVAITRARQRVVISNALSRTVFGERKFYPVSRFIAEIDDQFLNIQGNHTPRIRTMHTADTSYISQRRQPKYAVSIVGKLARHPDMGKGVIIEDSGDILTIAFRDKGIKKISRNFIEIDD